MFTEAGSYLRLIDSCITQLKAQGPSRTCSESKHEEYDIRAGKGGAIHRLKSPPRMSIREPVYYQETLESFVRSQEGMRPHPLSHGVKSEYIGFDYIKSDCSV